MVLDDFMTLLSEAGLGIPAQTLFKGAMPLDAPGAAVPDEVIALVETPGLPALYVHGVARERIAQPVVQVEIRSKQYDYESGRAKAEAAWQALDGLSNVTVNGTYYLWCLALEMPYRVRFDDLSRSHFLFRVRCGIAT